jgi:putative glutathione S-transferase
MGRLIDGVWHDEWYDTDSTGGKFVRDTAKFRGWITPDGAPGPGGAEGFPAESGRYHLYVSHACPWAHRTLIFRRLKGLEPHVTVDVVHPLMKGEGWTFRTDFDGATGDRVMGKAFMREIYTHAKPDASGRVTVPVLWDKARETIVSNESAEIIRMFNSAFDAITGNTNDYYPADMRDEIDALNERVYHTVNNGVYKAGFATTQAAYDSAVGALFESLDWLEDRLASRRFLTGARITEADWRLFTTLVRFDPVYVGHFKCNIRCLREYPNLWGYMLELYQRPGIAGVTRLDHVKYHYYASHETINPTGIVPAGPALDLDAPHGRERLEAA